MMTTRRMQHMINAIVATVLGLIVIFPIYWAFIASFFSSAEFSSWPPRLFPSSFSFTHYVRALTQSPLLKFMFNSLLVSGLGTIVRMIIAISAAFSVAFFSFRGKRILFFLLLGTMMLPPDALFIENYLTVSRLGLVDSYLGIMSVYLLGPVQVFMLRQSFKSIPKTYHEIATMDGCGDFRFLFSVVLPLSRSVVLTLSLHSFFTIWNTYLWPLLVTNDPNMRTAQVGITMLGYADSLDYGPVFAAISLMVLPSVPIFVLMRNRIAEGIKAGMAVG